MERSNLVRSAMEKVLLTGAPAVHLVADRRTLSQRREMYYRLAREKGQILQDVPVQMMEGWVRRLGRRFKLRTRRLSTWEQLALLRLCQGRVEPPEDSDLVDVWDRAGTVSSLHRFVSESRTRGLSARDLEGSLPGEIQRVVRMYERRLVDHGLADRSRTFEMIIKAIEADAAFHLGSVIVEGFSRFDYWEKKLLQAVSNKTEAMKIYIPSDPDLPDVYAPEPELSEELGPLFPHVTTYVPAEESPSFLSRRLFRGGSIEGDSGQTPVVKICKTADERKQNEYLGRLLKELLGAADVRPGDCRVVVRSTDQMTAVARQLQDLGIPVSHPEDGSLMDTRLGKTLSCMLDVMSAPRAQEIARLASSPYIGSKGSSLNRLGAYVGPGVSGSDILSSLETVRTSLGFRLQRGTFRWESPAELKEALGEVEDMIDALGSLLPLLSMPGSATLGEHWSCLRDALSAFGVVEHIEDAVREDGGRTPPILADLAAHRSFVEQMDRGLGQLALEWPGEHDREVFSRIVRDLLDHQRIRVPRSTESLSLNPVEGRGVVLTLADAPEAGRYRVVIMPYMVSDVFPARRTPGWIESSFLATSTLEDPSIRYRSENELFYRCAHSAGEHFILMYPAELGETPQVPSPYFHEIEAAGPVTKIDDTRDRGELARAASWRDLRVSLLLAGERGPFEKRGVLARSLVADRVPRALFERALEAEEERWGPYMGRWDGVIEGSVEARCLEDLFPTDARIAPTELNLFAGCPFHFFAAQALDLKGRFRVAEEVSAALLGRLYHTILEQYYGERVIDVALEREMPPQEKDQDLQGLVRSACDELQRAMGWIEDSQWQSLERRALAALETFLAFEEERRQAAEDDEGHLYPYKSEHRFSLKMRELFPGAPSDSLSELEVKGVMDRVDRTEAPGSARADQAVVFDYKLGSDPPGYDEMMRGLDLQMPLYVLAARAEFPSVRIAGGGYLSIGKAHANKGLYTREAADLLQLDPEKTSVSEEAFEDVLSTCREFVADYWERIRRGSFPVSPTDVTRCGYCPYAGLCRFEWERRGRKMGKRGESNVLSH